MKPFDWEFPYPSQRMPILARNVVATSQPLAAQAGLRMLMKGGSAVDAVLATAIALTVLEPTSNGIGSDAVQPFTLTINRFLVFTSADNEAIHCILDVMYTKAPYTVLQRAMHIHPTVSELIPTLLGELKPFEAGQH